MNIEYNISKIYAKAAFKYAKEKNCIPKWTSMLNLSSFIVKKKL
ncbi:hypothetical protein [Buchnera aphidicola]|nr:hypothetical protein [Buchnera aphidicola]